MNYYEKDKRWDKEDAFQKYIATRLTVTDYPYPWTSVEQKNMGGKGRVGMIRAKNAKDRGVQAGWPDMQFMTPTGVVFVELKSKKGSLNDNQKRVIPTLREAGYIVCVCKTISEVERAIKWVL